MGSGASDSGGACNKVLFSLLTPCEHFLLLIICSLTPNFSSPYPSPSLQQVALSEAGSIDGAVAGLCAVIPQAGNPASPPPTPNTYFPRACCVLSPALGAGETPVRGESWCSPSRSRAKEGDQKVKK